MRRLLVLTMLLVAAACGGGVDEAATTAPTTTPTSAAPTTTLVAAETTSTAGTATTPPTATTTTTTTEPPPPPLNVVGLVPLAGAHFDYSAQPVANSSLVWSLYSGSGGVIVENIGGPLPLGCHSVSFFDPETFDLLQIGGTDMAAYASRGQDGCADMQHEATGSIDGHVVTVNTPNLITFDFGGLPPVPFFVSTQVDLGGDDGIFRSAGPDDPHPVNMLDDATHVVGASGLYEHDPETGLLTYVEQPMTLVGPGCDAFSGCFQNGRFQVDITHADGTSGSPLTTSEGGGFFFFSDPGSVDALFGLVNACTINDHFWVFAAATRNVPFDLTVTDTLTGKSNTYFNPLDDFPEPIVDTSAFATCP